MSARILVVDDIEANVKLLEARLTAEYYEVLTASDGPTALALAASEKPDIVLLDVMMPGMDGFEVAQRLLGQFPDLHYLLARQAAGHVLRYQATATAGRERLVRQISGRNAFSRCPPEQT